MKPTKRDEWVYMAKIAEQAERIEDMIEAMKNVIKTDPDLNFEEKNLLSIAYRNTIGSHRTAFRVLSSIEKKKVENEPKILIIVKEYKSKIENQLNKYCSQILGLIKNQLLDSSASPETKVFYHKMSGDYYRYICEYTSGAAREVVITKAHDAYTEATEVAQKNFKTTHPIKLNLALNYSVFLYEVKNDRQKACKVAKQAFDESIANIDKDQ